MMGLPPRPAGQPLPYPTGAIWNTGALAEASGLDCKAKNPNFAEIWNVSSAAKKACALLPNPWNSEGNPWQDLTEFGLPWRWAGFMMNPILVTDLGDMADPEPSTGAKLNALGKNLSDARYHSHHAFMVLYHRVHKFFGSDQSWRTRGQGMNDAAVQAEFTSIPAIGQPNFRSEEHQQVHQLLMQNLTAMMQQLSQEL